MKTGSSDNRDSCSAVNRVGGEQDISKTRLAIDI